MPTSLTRRAALLAVVAAVGSGAQVSAYDSSSRFLVNVDPRGVALRGHDPVAYFTDGKAVKGAAAFATRFEGATYHFANAANKATFDKAPSQYVPQYGGFCAYAAARGYKADADPQAWSIVAGKLYVNYNASVARTWSQSSAKFITDGNANWPRMQAEVARQGAP